MRWLFRISDALIWFQCVELQLPFFNYQFLFHIRSQLDPLLTLKLAFSNEAFSASLSWETIIILISPSHWDFSTQLLPTELTGLCVQAQSVNK